MPRACTICSHEERKLIDAMIADRQPYLQIAAKFGLNQRTVNTHGKNHVFPFIEQIELQAQAAILRRVRQYRDEVNLPLSEKSKYNENLLRDEYDRCSEPLARVAIMKAIREQQQEQAKLTGAYQTAGPGEEMIGNLVRAFEIIDREFVEREGRRATPAEQRAIVRRILEMNGHRVEETVLWRAISLRQIDH